MKAFVVTWLLFIASAFNLANAQQYIDRVKFFKDTAILNAVLTMNIKKVLTHKSKEGYIFPATFHCKIGDSLNVNDKISIEIRGHFRRRYCFLPPIKLIYKGNPSAAFYKLKALKLVSACMVTNQDEQNLLKEFMIYKIYNLITDKSFRVRLLKLDYQDSSGRRKTVTEHAFLLEDVKELAKRNDCVDWTDRKYKTEKTDHREMTIVAIFEYMIGNTDWSVPVNHNIKLLRNKNDSISRPIVVPYDFDFSGMVNSGYSFPDQRLGIEDVRQRLYRGFPRTMDELNDVLEIFNKQKTNIFSLIKNFQLFTPASKKEMIDYLDEFYDTINDPSRVKEEFITKARTE